MFNNRFILSSKKIFQNTKIPSLPLSEVPCFLSTFLIRSELLCMTYKTSKLQPPISTLAPYSPISLTFFVSVVFFSPKDFSAFYAHLLLFSSSNFLFFFCSLLWTLLHLRLLQRSFFLKNPKVPNDSIVLLKILNKVIFLKQLIWHWYLIDTKPRNRTQISHIAGRFFTTWATGNSKNIGVGSLFLLQWIFPTQELNWDLLHCRWILYQLSYEGSPLNIGK